MEVKQSLMGVSECLRVLYVSIWASVSKCVSVCATDCSHPLLTYQMGKSPVLFLLGPQWPTCVALSRSFQGPQTGGRDGRIDGVERRTDYSRMVPAFCISTSVMSWCPRHSYIIGLLVRWCDELGMYVDSVQFSWLVIKCNTGLEEVFRNKYLSIY